MEKFEELLIKEKKNNNQKSNKLLQFNLNPKKNNILKKYTNNLTKFPRQNYLLLFIFQLLKLQLNQFFTFF